MSDSPAPAAPQSAHKAWAALLGALAAVVVPPLVQALIGLGNPFKIIFTWMVCSGLGATCPEPDDVLSAMLTVGGGIGVAILTGLAAYFIPNRSKP